MTIQHTASQELDLALEARYWQAEETESPDAKRLAVFEIFATGAWDGWPIGLLYEWEAGQWTFCADVAAREDAADGMNDVDWLQGV